MMPYPVTFADVDAPAPQPFRQVLFAGAARMDKGFGHVVDFVEKLRDLHETIPVSVQISGDYYGKTEARARQEIERLHRLDYPHLTERPETLTRSEYASLFAGSICLQPYDRHDFADRVSGVTLDALAAGCPLITTGGTWMARLVERFDAGVVVDELTAEELVAAVKKVITDYATYRQNSHAGGAVLREEIRAAGLVELLRQ
jgi:glycosyltransferase involved in cell wall biosynthesis